MPVNIVSQDEDLRKIVRELESINNFARSHPWKAYIPVWTAAGGSPAYGNAVVDAAYFQDRDIVEVWATIFFGSTTTFAGTSWSFSVPFRSKQQRGVVNAFYYDSSTDIMYSGAGQVNSSAATISLFQMGVTPSNVSTTRPFIWATDDRIYLQTRYIRTDVT